VGSQESGVRSQVYLARMPRWERSGRSRDLVGEMSQAAPSLGEIGRDAPGRRVSAYGKIPAS
jgi:hypothetical protein